MKHMGMAVDTTCRQVTPPSNVIFVSRYFYPFVGGLEKRVHALARGLTGRGIRVEIVTSRTDAEFPAEQDLEGVIIHRLACPRVKVIGACVFIVRLAFFLSKRRSQYCFLHAFQVGHVSAAAVCAGRLLGKHVFLHLSGGGSGGDVGRHIKTPWGIVFLALCRFASTIVVLNARMQEELRLLRYASARTACIPNGVDCALYHPHTDRSHVRRDMSLPEKPIILYTGRLSEEKGIATLVRACTRLHSPAAPVLYIIGNGPEQQRLENLARELNAGSFVVIVPACEDIRPWYQCADIFVMPSFHEGISNSVLEAMACALPVIATDVIGNSDLVRDHYNGLLVPPGNDQALAAALDELLDNPGNARQMGLRGQHIAQTNYSFDTMIERHCALYAREGT
jgi:glycosyltransferase involved in cell wall biosynthesis